MKCINLAPTKAPKTKNSIPPKMLSREANARIDRGTSSAASERPQLCNTPQPEAGHICITRGLRECAYRPRPKTNDINCTDLFPKRLHTWSRCSSNPDQRPTI